MTEQTLIIFLMLMLLLELLAMRHFWLCYERSEEEIKRLKAENNKLKADNDGLQVCNQILRKEIEKADAEYEDLVEQMED